MSNPVKVAYGSTVGIITCTDNKRIFIDGVYAHAGYGASTSAQIYIVPNGKTSDAEENRIIDESIANRGSYTFQVYASPLVLENTGDALQKMSYEDSALQKKLTEVRDDVMKTLDNLTTLGKGDTKILDRIASELETLREMGMTATDRAAIELELGNMRGFLEKGSTLSEVDIEKYTESVNNVGEIVLNTFREEHIGRQEVAEVTNRI